MANGPMPNAKYVIVGANHDPPEMLGTGLFGPEVHESNHNTYQPETNQKQSPENSDAINHCSNSLNNCNPSLKNNNAKVNPPNPKNKCLNSNLDVNSPKIQEPIANFDNSIENLANSSVCRSVKGVEKSNMSNSTLA